MPSVPLPDQDTLRRRVKAARQLAGYSVRELSDAIGENARLGERTLRKLEGGESQLQMPHLRAIAEACYLPVEFFTVDNIGMTLLAGAAISDEMESGKPYQPGDDLNQAIREMQERMAKLEQAVYTGAADSDSTRVATTLTRRLAVESAGADAETDTAGSARDEADANQESAPAKRRGNRRTARGSGR